MIRDGTSQLIVLAHSSVSGVYDSTYANPDEWLWEALTGGTRSDSDIVVTAEKALTFGPWFQGISIISGDCARVPCDIFERDADDDRIKHRDHPAYELLNRRANDGMHAFTLRELLLSHALSYGNGYAAIIHEGIKPVALVPIWPDQVTPMKGDNRNQVIYRVEMDGKYEYITSANMFHVRGLGTSLVGYSVFKAAKNAIGLGLSAERHGGRFFKNDAKPGVVLKYPSKLSKEDADLLLDQWEQRHNSSPGRPALAAGGLDVIPFPVSNEDAQFVESRKFQREDIASFLCLPPHKLGSDARLSYNSVEAEERAYVAQTLMRWFKRFEGEADLKLLTPREQRAWWYVEHNTGALIQGDFTTQSKVAVELRNAKIITQNEARKKFNLNSVAGGDEFENANTTSGSTTPANTSAETVAAHRELIADRIVPIVHGEIVNLKRLVEANSPLQSIAEFYDALEPKVEAALRVPLIAYRTVAVCNVTASVLAKRYCEASVSQLREVVATVGRDGLAGAIDATVASWPESRPQQMVKWITEGE